MKKIIEKTFVDTLCNIIPDDAESVLILSRLWIFANKLQPRKKNFTFWLFDLIDELVGPNRTLIYPAFTFSFSKTKKFDLLKSIPETGALPKAAMCKPSFSRTPAPLNSYFVRGPKKEQLLQVKQKTTFGSDSVPGWFEKNNTLICALGLPEKNMGWLMIHYAEQTRKVPYRYFKKLKGRYYLDGKANGFCSETHYVKPSSVTLVQDNTPLNQKLHDQGLVILPSDPSLPFKSAYAKDIVRTSLQILAANTFHLIVNSDDAKRWIKDHKYTEINALPEKNMN